VKNQIHLYFLDIKLAQIQIEYRLPKKWDFEQNGNLLNDPNNVIYILPEL